jgi:hypothetical protein
MSEILRGVSEQVASIDVYSAYYNQPFVSCYGESNGQRLPPVIFIEKNQNAFPHVCAWKYLDEYFTETDTVLQLDNFQGRITPAWRLLEAMKPNLQIFYSGSECNPVIATADILLRLVETFQFGRVDEISLFKPINDRVEQLAPKLRFHNMGGSATDQRATAPVLRVDINTAKYVKHPVYYMVSQRFHNKSLQPALEWGGFYNSLMSEATAKKGGVKLYDPERDFLVWDSSADFLVPDQQVDQETIDAIASTGLELPPVFHPI